MKEFKASKWVAVGLAALFVAAESFAQPGDAPDGRRRAFQRGEGGPGGRFGGRGGFAGRGGLAGRGAPNLMQLLEFGPVREELGLSSEQIEYLTLFREDQQAQRQELMAELGELEPEERRARFQELAQESRTSMEENLAQILEEGQFTRLKELRMQAGGPAALMSPEIAEALEITDDQRERVTSSLREVMLSLREAGERPDPAAIRSQIEATVSEVLNSKQREKLKGMMGEAADIDWAELRQQGRSGGPGGPGGFRPGGRPNGQRPFNRPDREGRPNRPGRPGSDETT